MVLNVIVAAVLAGSSPAAASLAPDGQRIVEHGSAGGAPPCASCHGIHLEGNEGIKAPTLAGKPAAFIVARLNHYAGPNGHNATMKQVAGALSISEREAVAQYITKIPPPKRLISK